MSHKFEEGKDIVLNGIIKALKGLSSKQEYPLYAEFVTQFLGTVALDDLNALSLSQWVGIVQHFWAMLSVRAPRETKINIYNPESKIDGFTLPYTILEVMTDDAPFLVDSIRMTLNRMGWMPQLVIHMGGIRLTRDEKKHHVNAIYPKRGSEVVPHLLVEAPIWFMIDRQTNATMLSELKKMLEKVLIDNHAVVQDWHSMREKIHTSILELDVAPLSLDAGEVEETKLFLKWIEDHHFTFLGMRDYRLVKQGKEVLLEPIPETGLGVLRAELTSSSVRNISAMTPEAQELSLSSRILMVSKTNTKATVHRDAYTDYIGIKQFNEQGQVVGERRIIGLYTSAAYNTSPKYIPFLRHKVALIMQNSLLNPRSHAGKVLMNILETLPRDDLIQASEEELLELSMGIFHMQERRRIRMFARMDVYRRFVSCLVYVPKDRFNTELRRAMQDILHAHFNAQEILFTTYFPESILARIHFIVRLSPDDKNTYDFQAIEQRLIEVGRSWVDDLQYHLREMLSETQALTLFAKYKHAFPEVYRSSFSAKTAVLDIQDLEKLSETRSIIVNFYQSTHPESHGFKLKLYRRNQTIALSDVLPILEQLGMRVISERPYVIRYEDESVAWVNEFSLEPLAAECIDFESMRIIFQETFERVWFNEAENDGFNQLVLSAGLHWKQVAILRTYAKYFKQIRFTFSQDYIESTLVKYPQITKKLITLFETRFTPTALAHREKSVKGIEREIIQALEQVQNLDEDKIIRQYVRIIFATLRTNYYQKNGDGSEKSYVSIKLYSQDVPGLPKPYPLYEIFIYSPIFEGIHLRGSKVARGGLRWSDRPEDFRTEILGLMKAQQVKNAVIVPNGAKGGFVVKKSDGVFCYRQFIRGLLELTDNYIDKKIVKPDAVYCYDEDDPYLVVAADKGTATFSDIANAIAEEFHFWLGDAFASGGSLGYDHKKMGITARGAWESVKRHFYQLGVNTQTTDFTVVGIGDMAGDVFGNGMLLSEHIRLVGAFNHQHIFIDPTPDAKKSMEERRRLFQLPRSTWEDYDATLISKGGGVFSRRAKSIPVSKEMKTLLGLTQSSIEPNELIRVLLSAKVDLLWSGGIGTFVKSSQESHLDVGDRTNDLIRVNANELQCKVVGEGGNLGLTQLARVEYALKGGLVYTDFIDNSAGVSCSDKEVNIKILCYQLMTETSLRLKERNALLVQMTDEVARLVLRDNTLQTRAISLWVKQAPRMIELHNRYLNALDQNGKLDRALDGLPDEKTLLERKLLGKGLTAPEIAVLLSQSKIHLKEAILASDVPEDPYFKPFLVTAFPVPLQEKYATHMEQHPLKREIIATCISNLIVNEMGFSFIYRMRDETGASVSSIVKAYMASRASLFMEEILKQIDALDHQIASEVQMEMMMVCIRLLRRTTRWFLRRKRTHLDIRECIHRYSPGVRVLKQMIPEQLEGTHKKYYDEHFLSYQQKGVSDELARELTSIRALFSVMDVIDIAHEHHMDVAPVARLYFGVGEFLDLIWIRAHIIMHPTENHWEALARESLRDELDWQHRQLVSGIMHIGLEAWAKQHQELIQRWSQVLTHLRASSGLNYTMYFVAIRELLDLTQTTLQSSGLVKSNMIEE